MTYPCPCCGYHTLTAEPPFTYQICPICFWEDDGNTLGNKGAAGSNQVSLRQAQRNFAAMGACEPHWLADVRSPTAADYRDPHWQTLDEQAEQTRQALIKAIQTAFATIELEDGTSLHEARALDDYEDPAAARRVDSHIRWQDIPDTWIEHFYDVFAFMNAKGLRYALPAYMIWCLKYERSETNSFAYTVQCLKTDYYRAQLHALLDADQEQLLAAFLAYVAADR